MSENTENRDLIDVAQEAVDPFVVRDALDDGPAGLFITRTNEVIDLRSQLGLLPEHPARKIGAYQFSEPASFVSYLDKHMAHGTTELFADDRACTIRAVINAHEPGHDGSAGFEDHTATLAMRHHEDWKDWTSRDGQLFPQLEFSEFIEDHLPNFATPTGADMLELAQTFQATTKVDFASRQRVKSGETQLLYTEDTKATAGRKGSLAIPDTFDLGLQVFERGKAYRVSARFRYRIHDGQLRLGYRLTRPRDVTLAAFDEVVTEVAKGVDNHPIWTV